MSMNVRKATINVIRTPFVSTLLDPITVTVAKATTAPVINVQVMYIHHIINMPAHVIYVVVTLQRFVIV